MAISEYYFVIKNVTSDSRGDEIAGRFLLSCVFFYFLSFLWDRYYLCTKYLRLKEYSLLFYMCGSTAKGNLLLLKFLDGWHVVDCSYFMVSFF